jgi:hypothetical protein
LYGLRLLQLYVSLASRAATPPATKLLLARNHTSPRTAGDSPDPLVVCTSAADQAGSSPFADPSGRNPIYQGTGTELDYAKAAVGGGEAQMLASSYAGCESDPGLCMASDFYSNGGAGHASTFAGTAQRERERERERERDLYM